jgi:ubiquinone/menaquinone biosynthesis C-methylase UbiE
MDKDLNHALAQLLWKIYRRPERPQLWTKAGDFHWTDPDFSKRVLLEHLDETYAAASRVAAERELQLDWLWQKLQLQPGAQLLDVTCGPGLYAVEFARRGCIVTGLDYSPVSIAYARELAAEQGLAGACTFIEQDVRHMNFVKPDFDAAILLYGQLAAFPPAEAQTLLEKIAAALRPEGRLCVEILNQDRVDKIDSTWWFTDDKGLWGEGPFLHLGERFWNEAEENSVERYHIIHLETGELTEVLMYDQTYAAETMAAMMSQAGFDQVDVYLDWDDLPLYDADEWVAYIAAK